MEKSIKLLSLSILITGLIVASAILIKSFYVERYSKEGVAVFDKMTGSYYYYNGKEFTEINPVKKYKK